MASSENPNGTAANAGSAAVAPNRLLAASRVVHQLWRTQDRKIDLNRLLADEVFAKTLLQAAKVYADPKTSAMIEAFEKASLEKGAWSTQQAPVKPAYKTNADGSISAAAAWDPDYVPATNLQDVKPEAEYIPTTSPRTSISVKDAGNSSFISRFGFSRPVQTGDADPSVRKSSGSLPPNSRSAGASTQSPASEPSDGPVDPNHKKYIRGAR